MVTPSVLYIFTQDLKNNDCLLWEVEDDNGVGIVYFKGKPIL